MTKLLRAALGIIIGLVFLWLALRNQNLAEVRAVWARSDASWLLSGSAVYATSLIVRVVRWSRLLAALGRVRIRDVGEVLLVGNAVNNILPARLGELVRADYGKQRLGQTRSSLLATIFVERLADLAAIVAALLSGIVVVGPRLYDGGRAWNIVTVVGLLGVCLFAVALASAVLVPRTERASQWLPRFARLRLDDLITGLRSWSEVRKLPFAALTLGVWSLEAAALACILRASGIDCGLFELLLIVGLVNLGTLVPTAPAYLGSYQFTYAVAFSALAWAPAHGIAVATIAQAFLLVPATLLGIVILILRSTARVSARTWLQAARRRPAGTTTASAQHGPPEGLT